jgi:hypothetical protein
VIVYGAMTGRELCVWYVIYDSVKNQPKSLTKGGVLRKRQTSSLNRFDHSCVRNALLEMVKGALKL